MRWKNLLNFNMKLLKEINTLNEETYIAESVGDVCSFLKAMYDNAQDDSNDINESYKASRYLAFLIAYRDLDYVTRESSSNPLPIEHFLKPGIRPTMKTLQFFAKKCEEHPQIMKKVENYTNKFMSPTYGRQMFDYQLKKIEHYFQHSKPKKKTNAEEHSDSINMSQYIP